MVGTASGTGFLDDHPDYDLGAATPGVYLAYLEASAAGLNGPSNPIWLLLGHYFTERYLQRLSCVLTDRSLTALRGTPLGQGQGPIQVESKEAFWTIDPPTFSFDVI